MSKTRGSKKIDSFTPQRKEMRHQRGDATEFLNKDFDYRNMCAYPYINVIFGYMSSPYTRFYIASFALISSLSCVDDLDFDKLSDARPAPNVIVPVVDLSMRLNDLVERDTILTEDPDGFLRFAYAEDSLFSMTIREFVEIPEQEAMNLENIPILQDSALGFTVEAGLASLGSMELQQLTFDQLGLAWAISTPAQAPVSVRYTFNNGLIGGTPLQLTVQTTGAGDTAGLANFKMWYSISPRAAIHRHHHTTI